MGSSGSATTTSTYQPPAEVLQNYQYVTDLAKQAQQQPFTPYGGEMVAGLTPTQEAGITNVNQAVGTAAPAYGAALGGTLATMGGYSPQAYQQGVAGYMSPYLGSAMGLTAAQLQNVAQQQQQQMIGDAISKGAYGGDRARIGLANLINQQNLALGQTLGQMAQQGYGQAAQNYLAGLGQQGALSAQLGQLGAGAQTAALQGAQAQLAAGAQQQATQQAQLQADYNQFLQQQAYPFQTTQFLANIAEGIGAGSGGTSTTQAPGPNVGNQIFGALGALSLLSDPRTKENMEPVGETYDGQKIYKFNYKGDPRTQIGLNAAEVEHHKPESVSKTSEGLRTVNYDTATEDAANKGHFAAGGVASMGGAVHEGMDRQNFELGGSASLGDIPYLDFLTGLTRVPTVKKIGGKPTIPDAPKAFVDKSGEDVAQRMAQIKSYSQPGRGMFGSSGLFGAGGLFGSGGGSYGYATGLEPGAFADGGVAGRSEFRDGAYVSPNDPNAFTNSDDMTSRIASALGAIESGQDYSAVGPATKSGDKAYGFSQVMGANIPKWTKQYYGQELTPEDYLKNPQAQVAVTRGHIGDLVQSGYSPQDVASIWFSGRPRDQAGNVADVTGTTVDRYLNNFNRAFGTQETGLDAGQRADRGSMSLLESALGRRLDPDVKMALLTGALGTMASTSPFFGVAVGQGGLGAVANYMQQKQAEREYALGQQRLGLEQQRVGYEGQKTAADVAEKAAITKKYTAELYSKIWVPGYGYVLTDNSNPLAPPMRLTDEKMKPLPNVKLSPNDFPTKGPEPAVAPASAEPGGSTTEPGTTGAIPAQAAEAAAAGKQPAPAQVTVPAQKTSWTPNTKLPEDYVPEEHLNIMMNPELRKSEGEMGSKMVETMRDRALAADNQLFRLGTMDENYNSLPKTGFLASGSHVTERLNWAKSANTYLSAIGAKPMFNESDVAALEELVKDKYRLGADLSRSIGGREPGYIVEQSVQANPGADSSAMGYKRITEGLRAAAQYDKDRSAFFSQYQGKFGHLNGAQELFDQMNPPEKYSQMAILRTVKPKHADQLKNYASQNANNPAAVEYAADKFDKTYGKGTSDLVLGGL